MKIFKEPRSAVLAENDVVKKQKLEDTVAALLHLKDEKEYLIEQNNKVIDTENYYRERVR